MNDITFSHMRATHVDLLRTEREYDSGHAHVILVSYDSDLRVHDIISARENQFERMLAKNLELFSPFHAL